LKPSSTAKKTQKYKIWIPGVNR